MILAHTRSEHIRLLADAAPQDGGYSAAMTLHRRQLTWAGCANVRHLGGLSASMGTTHALGLIRADNLSRLTLEGQQAVRDSGVSAVVDLRSSWELEIEQSVFALSPEAPLYLHRPLMDDSDPALTEQINNAADLAEMYRLMLEHFGPNIVRIMRAIADAPPGAVVVHCHAGKDRTGLVAALALALVGVPNAQIVEDYVLSDLYLSDLATEMLNRLEDPLEREAVARSLSSRAESIEAVLEHLHTRYGGAAPYLHAQGLEESTLERLRARLLQV